MTQYQQQTPKYFEVVPFNSDEDVAVCKAYIAISENAVTGTEMKVSDFYEKIFTIYNNELRPTNRDFRSMTSIRARCKTIIKETTRFHSCYLKVQRTKPTGCSPSDIIDIANQLYQTNKFEQNSTKMCK